MNDFIIDQDRNLYRDRLYSKAINNEEASLQHYGVLGMKWGVRKAKDTGGSGKKRKGKNSKNSNKSKAEKTKSALKTAGKIALGVAGVAGAALAGKAIYDNRDDIMNMGAGALDAIRSTAGKVGSSVSGFVSGLSGNTGNGFVNMDYQKASGKGRALRKDAIGAAGSVAGFIGRTIGGEGNMSNRPDTLSYDSGAAARDRALAEARRNYDHPSMH